MDSGSRLHSALGPSLADLQTNGGNVPTLQYALSWAQVQARMLEQCHTDLLAAPQLRAIGFELETWWLDRLAPPKLWPNLQAFVKTTQVQVFFTLACQSKIAPTLWQISASGLQPITGPTPSEFWQTQPAQTLFHTLFQTLLNTLDEHALGQAILALNSSQTNWLTHLQLTLDLHALKTKQLVAKQQAATQLWPRLVTLLQAISKALTQKLQNSSYNEIKMTTFDAVHNPIAALCRWFETQTITGGVYSIGAGQMISILDYCRQLMDQGQYPLTTPLLADNRALSAVAELYTTGQRRALLNDLWINPNDCKPIAVYGDRLRQDLISQYQPQILFLNVKAQAITTVMSDEFCEFLVALPYTPILVMPSKSYTGAGKTPYQALYHKLKHLEPTTGSTSLANQLTVLGGFYAAPSILSGDHVHFTIAAERLEAAITLAKYLSLNSPTQTHTTVRNGQLQLELLDGFDQAALLMAGGANKNFLTYTSARKLLKQAFAMDHTDQHQWLGAINSMIKTQAQGNIETSNHIAQQLLQLESKSNTSTKAITSLGLQTDFIHCLPLTSQGVCALVEATYRLLRHLLRTPADLRESVARERLQDLIEFIRTDPLRSLGTRNARDGFIDELLHFFFYAWEAHKNRMPLTLEFAKFYDAFYPAAWKGEQAQEGRNGIVPIVVRAAILSDIQSQTAPLVWPEQLFEAWQFYCPTITRTKFNTFKTKAFQHWHQCVLDLIQWCLEYCEDPQLQNHGLARLHSWCEATRAQSLKTLPELLFTLEQGLQQGELIPLCQRILRDCQ